MTFVYNIVYYGLGIVIGSTLFALSSLMIYLGVSVLRLLKPLPKTKGSGKE